MTALADHVQKFHLNVHAGLHVQYMAVDDGANSVAAGDEALPLQRGQDIPQLCAADAEPLRQNALPGQALAGGVFAAFHGGQQLGADRFGLRELTAHSGSPRVKIKR